MCNQYIYELHERERKIKVAETFSELEQKESNELQKIVLNIGELSSEAEEDAEMEGEEIEEEKYEKEE